VCVSVCDYRWVFGLHIGFIDHLYTQLRTMSNYDATTNLRNSQITTAPAKPFPACCVFTSHSLVMASNSGDSSASTLRSSLNGSYLPTVLFLHSLPYRTDLAAPVVFLISPQCEPCRQRCSFSYADRFCGGNVFASPSSGLHNPIC
jgi:hypothetical protein